MKLKVGPQPLTIEEYRQRQANISRKQQKQPTIPHTPKPKKRGGYINKLRRERAILIRLCRQDQPPPWEQASRLWEKINHLEFLIKQHLVNKAK